MSQRHHARFWDTRRQDPATHQELWIGDCSEDIGIKILRRHKVLVGTTHRIDGDLDKERSYIVSQMKSAGEVSTVIMEPGMGKTTNAVNGDGDRMWTDGKAALIVLK